MNEENFLPLMAMLHLGSLIGVPVWLGFKDKALSTGQAIALSTFLSAVLPMTIIWIVGKLAMWVKRAQSAGVVSEQSCSGGECGPALMAAGYAPFFLAIYLAFMVLISAVLSCIVILLMRRRRRQ